MGRGARQSDNSRVRALRWYPRHPLAPKASYSKVTGLKHFKLQGSGTLRPHHRGSWTFRSIIELGFASLAVAGRLQELSFLLLWSPLSPPVGPSIPSSVEYVCLSASSLATYAPSKWQVNVTSAIMLTLSVTCFCNCEYHRLCEIDDPREPVGRPEDGTDKEAKPLPTSF